MKQIANHFALKPEQADKMKAWERGEAGKDGESEFNPDDIQKKQNEVIKSSQITQKERASLQKRKQQEMQYKQRIASERERNTQKRMQKRQALMAAAGKSKAVTGGPSMSQMIRNRKNEGGKGVG